MVAAVYILHWPDPELEFRRSEVLLHRNYVNDIPDAHALVSRFNLIYKKLEAYNRSPCIHDNGLNYIYIWGKNDIMLLTVARININVMLITVFLSQFYPDSWTVFQAEVDAWHELWFTELFRLAR